MLLNCNNYLKTFQLKIGKLKTASLRGELLALIKKNIYPSARTHEWKVLYLSYGQTNKDKIIWTWPTFKIGCSLFSTPHNCGKNYAKKKSFKDVWPRTTSTFWTPVYRCFRSCERWIQKHLNHTSRRQGSWEIQLAN